MFLNIHIHKFLNHLKSEIAKIYIEVPFDNFRLKKKNKYWEKKRHYRIIIPFSKKSLIKLTERMKIKCLYCEVNFIKIMIERNRLYNFGEVFWLINYSYF